MEIGRFTGLTRRVISHWQPLFAGDRPLEEELLLWAGIEYPPWSPQPLPQGWIRGTAGKDTDFASCVIQARHNASKHLRQLAQALDNPEAARLHRHLDSDHEVLVVDIGCAGGILALLADRAGFARYWGVDINPYMRSIVRAVTGSVRNFLVLVGANGRPEDFGEYGDLVFRPLGWDSRMGSPEKLKLEEIGLVGLDGELMADFPLVRIVDNDQLLDWTNDVRLLSDPMSPIRDQRMLTVLVVMNHFLWQPDGVRDVVERILDSCSSLAKHLPINMYLLSIEPGGIYPRPHLFGPMGFDVLLRERSLVPHRFPVQGTRQMATGDGQPAEVRLVTF